MTNCRRLLPRFIANQRRKVLRQGWFTIVFPKRKTATSEESFPNVQFQQLFIKFNTQKSLRVTL